MRRPTLRAKVLRYDTVLTETNKNQQQVGIVGLSDHFKKIFNMVGITKFAKLYNTQEAALKFLGGEKNNENR